MQKFTAVLVALIFFTVSCGESVEKYRNEIETLSTNWQETTNMVTDLLGKVQGEQSKAQTMLAQMEMPEGFTMTQDEVQEAQKLKATVQEKVGTLSSMVQTISAFAQDWQSKASEVEALTGALTSGEVGEGMEAKIESLKSTVDDARNKVDEWNSAYDDATQSYTSAYDDFMELLPEEDAEGDM